MLFEFLGASALVRFATVVAQFASSKLGGLVMDLLWAVTPLIWNYFRAYKEYDQDCDKDDVVFTNYPDERWLEVVTPVILDKLKPSRGRYMLTEEDLAILHAEMRIHRRGLCFALHKNDEDFRLTVNGKYGGVIKNIAKNNGRRLSQHQQSLNKLRMGTTVSDDQCKAVFFDTSSSTSSVMYAYNKNHFKGVVEGPTDRSNSDAGTSKRINVSDSNAGTPRRIDVSDSNAGTSRRIDVSYLNAGTSLRQESSRAVQTQGIGSYQRRRNSYLISEVPSVMSKAGESTGRQDNQRKRSFYVVSKVQPVMSPQDEPRRDDAVVSSSLRLNNLVKESPYVVGGALDYPEDDSVVYVASHQLTG